MRQHTGIAAGLAFCLSVLASVAGGAEPQYQLGDSALDLALRKSGWEIRRVEGEGLLLYPPQAAQGRAEANAQEKPPAAAAPTAGSAASGAGPDWDRLRGLGWRVEQAADGSTLLYPPAPTAAAGETKVASAAQPDKDLDALLRERGWRVERDAQGSLLIYPRTPAPARPEVTPVSGVETAPVRDAAVALPVDRWAEARTIADAWLAERGAPDWRVGKIRQVHRVYLVSILDGARPPNLVHQIAILSGNGLVVVLN